MHGYLIILPASVNQPLTKMRAKRSKQYRKLMLQYQHTFSFREPYQVIVDAHIVLDAFRYRVNLPAMLESTLHGKVKISGSNSLLIQCFSNFPSDYAMLYASSVRHRRSTND